MSINTLENFAHYDIIAIATTAIMTFVDANRDIWLPKNWLVKLEIYALIGILCLVNGLFPILSIPYFRELREFL